MAVVESTIAQTIQDIWVSDMSAIRLTQISTENLFCLLQLLLIEVGVSLKIGGSSLILGLFHIGLSIVLLQVFQALIVLMQSIMTFCSDIECFGLVIGRFRSIVNHLRHPCDSILHFILQERINTHLVAQILKSIFQFCVWIFYFA